MKIAVRTIKIHQRMIDLFNAKITQRKKMCLEHGIEYRPYGNVTSVYREIAKELAYSPIAIRKVIVEYHKTKSI